MKPYIKKYLLRMTFGFIGYGLGIWVALHFYVKQSPNRYWLILFPVIPIIYLVATMIRAVLEMDEMCRKIHMEAMAFSGLATGFTCISCMFFRIMGAPAFPLDWAFYIMWIYYSIGIFFSMRRYK
jgi:hypothetical protein